MSSAKRIGAVLLAAGGLALAASGVAQAASGWQQDPVPVAAGNILAQTAVSDHVTWAAGFQLTRQGKSEILNPLLLSHDDRSGTGWHRIATPADAVRSRINALAAAGPHDVWLVGDNDPGAGAQLGTPILTEHWDGKAWKQASAPVPDNSVSAGFLGVTVLNPHDAWAVGWAQEQISSTPDPTTGRTQVTYANVGLVEHWDGHSWQQSATGSAVAAPAGSLNSISAAAPNDIWAAGYVGATDQPMLLHYDGKSWTRQADLPATGLYGEFNTVVATSPHDIWAAGRTILTDSDRGHPLVEHFDGKRWQAVAAPGTGVVFAAAATPGGVTVVGYDKNTGQSYGERYSRGSWLSLGLPTIGADSTPYSVAATSHGMTVGGAYDVAGDDSIHPLLLSAAK